MNKDGDLIPHDALKLVNDRMRSAVDSGKYEAWDWLTNLPYTRQDILDKIGRHHKKRDAGYMSDEDGSHAAAIVANGLMLMKYEIDGLPLPEADSVIGKGITVGRKCCEQTDSPTCQSGNCDKG